MLDPVELYRNGICRKIPAIDANTWISLGWSINEINSEGTDVVQKVKPQSLLVFSKLDAVTASEEKLKKKKDTD